ncbi:MFS transporter [Nonomuraea jabiensis]|uniref:MFS family permease n=1 Tax=Nonomuraea jabiensis TaxID=882448 RepID=A0A7W9LDN5_9ACTN|nr:MFS transporter [Nonomuraea jabiensis]MBB5779969.1 MFS family permease [Nonomuraea jabiensis]
MVSERVTPQPGPITAHDAETTSRPVLAWGMTAMLLGVMLIAYLDKAILGLVAQPAMAELGLSAAEFGAISSAAGLLGPLSVFLYALVADRLPVKATLFTAVVIWSLLQLPVFFAASGALLLVTRFMLGAAEGPATPAAYATAYSWWPNERRGLPTALLTTGASFGKLIFAPPLAFVIAAFGWETGFVAVAVLGLAWAVGWLFIGREGPYSQAAAGRAAGPVAEAAPRAPIRSILLTGTFAGFVAASTASATLAIVVLTWLPSYFQVSLGFSAVAAGSLFGVPSIAAMVFLYGFGAWSDRMLKRGTAARRARGLLGGALLALGGVFLAALPLSSGVAVPIALLMLGYGLAISVNAVLNPALVQIVPAGQQRSVLSIGLAATGVLAAAGPLITGHVLDGARATGTLADGYTTVFVLTGVVALAGGALFALLVNPERDAAKVEAARLARGSKGI